MKGNAPCSFSLAPNETKTFKTGYVACLITNSASGSCVFSIKRPSSIDFLSTNNGHFSNVDTPDKICIINISEYEFQIKNNKDTIVSVEINILSTIMRM